MRVRLASASCSWSRCAPGAAVPAPASPDVPVFRTSTDLVTVDAVVTDSDGKRVTDLTREDFEVTVAGKRQTLDQALYVRTQDQPRLLAAARAAAGQSVPAGSQARAGSMASEALRTTGTSPEGVARTIALTVDDLGLSFDSISTCGTRFTNTSIPRSSRGISSPSSARPAASVHAAVHDRQTPFAHGGRPSGVGLSKPQWYRRIRCRQRKRPHRARVRRHRRVPWFARVSGIYGGARFHRTRGRTAARAE